MAAFSNPTDDTRTGPTAADDGDEIGFLDPSEKPGSMGRLGHYEVQEVVGRGGMGVVLKAFDERLHRVVAIKVMAPQLASSATARRRFTREARAAAAVTHDHIVTIHAVEDAGPLPYIVMQFVAGVSLQDRLDRTGSLQLDEVLRIGMQAASGLAAAHSQGLVHRDVKPANILLENGVERVKLTDFGLARAADDASLTQSGAVAGTPSFMSPEQAEGKPIDHRSDLFSLGSVLYAMCTGRPPFRSSTSMGVLKRVCEETPTPIRETNSEVPDWLAAVVEKLHAKDPAARFQSAAELADVLGRHLAHVQHPSVVPLSAFLKSPDGSPSATRPARRNRWAVAAAVLVAMLAVLGTTEATGVTGVRATVIRVFTPEGTLVVEVDDPDVTVTIEGDGGLVITGAGPKEVRVRPGTYTVRASKDGKPVTEELISITRGGKETVRVRREPPATALRQATKPVLLMHFDKADFYEKDGRTYVRDRSGKGNDGLCEQVQFTPQGNTGGGLANAGEGFLRLPSSLIWGQSQFTIAAWVKNDDLTNHWAVYKCVTKDYPAIHTPSFNFFWTNHLYVGAWSPAPGDWMHAVSPAVKVSPGEWTFVAVTLENGAPGQGRVRLMLNDGMYDRPFQQVGGGPSEWIQDLAALKLKGVLDELAVWDRALTEQELRELFALGQAGLKK
jgi:hypothetical protein